MSWLTRVDYMKSAKRWLVFSVVLMVASIIALATMGLNQGIDFTGGDLLDVQFQSQVTSAQVEQAVFDAAGGGQVQQAEVKGADATQVTEFLIRTPEMTPEVREKLLTTLEGLSEYKILGEDNVSATVSKELTTKAAMAIGLAALLQVVYIWFRFELKFGVTAVAALLHDVIITMGLMSIFRVQVNAAFVAAILTVLGYSMNDTIVVFDRIRENLHKRKKGESLEALSTRSIQEVITRSLYTGVSVQLMLLALIFLGGDTIWDFAMTLFIGVTAGTYSSIFIATALWLFWRQAEEKRPKKATAPKPARA